MSILTLPVITDYGLWEGEEGTSIGLLHRRNALCGSRAEPVHEGWLRSVGNPFSSVDPFYRITINSSPFFSFNLESTGIQSSTFWAKTFILQLIPWALCLSGTHFCN